MFKYDAIKKIINESGKSVNEWSNLTGVSRQHIYRWIKGETKNIRPTSLDVFAKYAGYKIKWKSLDRQECDLVPMDDITDPYKMESMSTMVPVVSFTDAGRKGVYTEGDIMEYISRPQGVGKSAYAVTINRGADSMPPFVAGTKLIASPNVEVQTGDLAIVRLNNGAVFFKKIRIVENGFELQSYSEKYEPMVFMKDEVESCHPVFWIRLPR